MNIDPTEKQSVWCEDIKKFAAEELTFDLERRDQEAAFLEENWQACAKKGIMGLNMPTEYGGSGHDLSTSVHIMEAMGYACPDNGLTLALNGQMWAVQEPIVRFGTNEQKAEFLPRLIDGRAKGAHAMTEEVSGSDAFSLKTTAKRTQHGYLLNGKKIFIGLGPVADLILVFASTKPDFKKWGLSAFVIEADLPGITLHSQQNKMGLRTSPLGEISFDNVEIPAQSLLGKEGAGASIFSASMDYERSFTLTSHVGSMRRQLDEVIAFAKRRRVGGASIGNYQSVSNRIADMRVRVQTARFFLHRSAALLAEGNSIPMEAAMAKLVISEAFVENSLSAIRTHGGTGYLSATGVERDLRDAVGGVIYSGTSDIQRNLIARLLGL